MKNLIEFFNNKNYIFKELNPVLPKELASRKKIEIYDALGVNKAFYVVFIINSKSRFISKNATNLIELLNKLIILKEHNYKYKILIISSPICNKSKTLLKENGFKIFEENI